jgi:hypothetical protein
MFYLLSDMTRKCFVEKQSIKWYKTYMAVFRTCAEIAKERGYHKGIKKKINKYINNKNNFSVKIPFDNDILFGQILSTGCIINKDILKKFCIYYFENVVSECVIKSCNCELYKEYILESKNINIDNLIKKVESAISYETEMIVSNYKMVNIMINLKNKYGGYMKILKTLDDNYGILDEQFYDYLNKNIKQIPNFITGKYLFNELEIDNKYDDTIIKYVHNAIFTESNKKKV